MTPSWELIIGVIVGFIGGRLAFHILRRTAKPDWIKDVVKAEVDVQFHMLRDKIEDQQNKIGQAYQVLGHWSYHFAQGTKPSDEEIERGLDYFGIEEKYDRDFLKDRIVP